MPISVIILGLSPTAKYLARECYLAGLPCIGIGTNKGSAYYSKYWTSKKVYSEQECEAYLKSLLIDPGQAYVVCPTSDEWIEFIVAHRQLFRNTCLYTSSGYLDGTYAKLGDKKRLQRVCEDTNIPYPKSIAWVCEMDKYPEVPPTMRYPFFCKPTNRAGLAHIMKGQKGWVVENSKDLEQLLNRAPLEGIELIIQEVIEGPEENIQVLGAIAGEKSPYWTGIKVRQFPPGFGSASKVVQDDLPALRDIADQLIHQTGYNGYFALEVKYCELRKQTYVIEVNTRPGLWFGITTDAGAYMLPFWLQSLGFPDCIRRPLPIKQNPTIWRYWYKDWAASLLQRKNNQKQPSIHKKGLKSSYAVWDINDPLPFFMDILGGINKWFLRK